MRYFPFLPVIAIVCFLSSCHYVFSGKRVSGNGTKATQVRQTGNFNGIDVKGSVDVEVAQEAVNSLKIEGDENLLGFIDVDNKGGILQISTRPGFDLHPQAGLKVYAAAPAFNNLEVTGSGNIQSGSMIAGTDHLRVEIKGSGDVQLEVDAPKVDVSIAGSGKVSLKGTTQNFSTEIKGSGDVHGFNLMSENTVVDIAGSGNAEVFASKQLNIEIKGAGDVAYKGTATVQQKILGSGEVKKVQ
jgi:hypothetical protein